MRKSKSFATFIVAISAMFLLVLPSFTAFAEDEGKPVVISSNTTSENEISIFIKNIGSVDDGSTVQIGNTVCENIEAVPILSTGIPIRTAILLDNSLSFSGIWGENGKGLLNEVINNHSDGELFSIYTFSDSLKIISDFTDNYDQLINNINNIQYENQDTFLTDALYELISSLNDDNSNYTRVLVVSDGADENEITYTQAELLDLMKSSRIPVYAVGAKGNKNSKELETLFSYARQTGGDYYLVEKDQGFDDIVSSFTQDYSIIQLTVIPDNELQDGSSREAKLTLLSGGQEITLTTTLRMPFGDGIGGTDIEEEEIITEPEEETAEQEEPVATEEQVTLPETEENNPEAVTEAVLEPETEDVEEQDTKKRFPFFIIPIIAVVIVVGAGAFVFYLWKKKNSENKSFDDSRGTEGYTTKINSIDLDKTLVLNEEIDKTVFLNADDGETLMMTSWIKLVDNDKPERTFRVRIDDKVTVGRTAGADIVLDFDQAVSRRHCEFVRRGGNYYVKDLDSGNGTKYSGVRVTGETPIASGGIVEIGRGKYTVTIEE